MDEDALRADISRSVLRFIASVVIHNHAVSQRVGLGASDSQFVNLLDLHGPLSPGRLAGLTGLTTGTVTGVIDRLEKAGYLRRERDVVDRRKVLVTLVPEAMAALATHYREHGDHMEAVLRRRGADELQVIAEFLADMTGTPGGARGAHATDTDDRPEPAVDDTGSTKKA